MKILMVTSYGFNTRMRNFIEFIVARTLVKNNWKVAVLAKPEPFEKEYCESDGVKIFKPQSNIVAFFQIARILFFKKPDIIHIFNMRNNPFGIMAAMIARLSRKPYIFTEYGLLHDHYLISDRDNPFPLAQKFNKNGAIFSFWKIFKNRHLKSNIKNYLFHFPINNAEKIVFISKHNIDIAQSLGLKNIYYLPHILDNKRWTDQIETGKDQNDKLNILENFKSENMILFIGQMKLRKGWDIMLEAMPHINRNIVAKLIFITPSSDSEPPEFSDKINKLRIRDRVIFLGKVEGEALKKVYRISKVIIVPSRYEGFGLAVVEAWEMRKPVVASDVIAINEHVKNGYNGILVAPENPEALARAIEKVTSDQSLSDVLVKGGDETLSKLKSAEVSNQWLEFYKKSADLLQN